MFVRRRGGGSPHAIRSARSSRERRAGRTFSLRSSLEECGQDTRRRGNIVATWELPEVNCF